LSGSTEIKYKGIVLLKDDGHNVLSCCSLLGVSTSGFYDWLRRRPSKRAERCNFLKEEIVSIHHKTKARYGSPRVYRALLEKGVNVSENTVAKLMAQEGIKAVCKQPYRPKTTINNPSEQKSPRVFKITKTPVEERNVVWASDLTYLPIAGGFYYLTVVMDLFNREIIGWDVSQTMEAENTKTALIGAIREAPGPLEKLVFHSDQGSQYCSGAVRDVLKLLQITQSMSRKGNCYDNAFVESFFSTLKRELGIKGFASLAEAKREIFEYINWYNRERLHSSLGYRSPIDYAQENHRAA
jgi:putative transposase